VGESGESISHVPPRRPTAAARHLLEVTLDSFEKLEIAIALRRAAAQSLSLSELSAALQLSTAIVERGIDELALAGVVQFDSGVARLSLDPQDAPALDEIAALHDEDRLLLVRTLTEISMERMRGMAARAFADAFQFRRKKEENGDS
jgi:hypothetical protein